MVRRALAYLRRHRVSFGLALGQVLLLKALERARPWPTRIAIDRVLGSGPAPAWLARLAPELLARATLVMHRRRQDPASGAAAARFAHRG